MPIKWNHQADRFLTALQREAVENGERSPNQLEGHVETDEHGNVWHVAGEHRKLVGEGGEPTLADGRPASESAAERNLDAPSSARKVARKSKPKAKAKK